MMLVAIVASLLGVLVWLWRGRRDPLLHLVPFVLAFIPVLTYGGGALGWPGGWLSTREALLGCIGLFLAFRLLRKDFSRYPILGVWFVAPYLLLIVISVAVSCLRYNEEVGVIANELMTWVILIAVFFLIASSRHGPDDAEKAFHVITAAAIGAAIFAGFQVLAITGNDFLVPGPIAALTEFARGDLGFGSLRIYGTLPNLGPNFFGAFLLVPAVMAFSRGLGQRGLARLRWFLPGIVFIGVIAGTYSRGAMLGLCGGLVVLPVWRRQLTALPLMAGALVFVGTLVAVTPIGRHVGSLYAEGRLDVSASARVDTWKAVVENAPEHPFGLGFNGWPRASRSIADVGLLDPPWFLGRDHPAENQWMRELADRGILGVALLAILLGGLMRLTFRAADPDQSSGYTRDFIAAVGASTVGWALVFLTGDHLMSENVAGMFWYPVAVALAVARDVVWLKTTGSALSDTEPSL
jgi:hypothetical protein